MTRSKLTQLFCPFDWLITGYAVLMVVVLLFLGRPFNQFSITCVMYALCGITPYVVCRITEGKQSVWAKALRWLYPVILFTPFYRFTGSHMFLLFDQFLDAKLIAFETGIFSVEPTLFFDRYMTHPLFTDVVTFCYSCYYLMIPLFAFFLFRSRQYAVLADSMTAICIMFFASYLLFFLFPIEGPRWFQAAQYVNPVRGYIFRPMIELIQREGAVHGGGMPSSHTGVALVILCYTWRVNRKWGKILAVIVIGLGIGAIWGRYHYVSDIIVGAGIGVIAVYIADRLLSVQKNAKASLRFNETSIAHVS